MVVLLKETKSLDKELEKALKDASRSRDPTEIFRIIDNWAEKNNFHEL